MEGKGLAILIFVLIVIILICIAYCYCGKDSCKKCDDEDDCGKKKCSSEKDREQVKQALGKYQKSAYAKNDKNIEKKFSDLYGKNNKSASLEDPEDPFLSGDVKR